MNNLENIVKTKQVRVKRAPERYNEDGTYNNKPTDPDYFNNYYKNHLELTTCTFCKHSYSCKAGLNKHLARNGKCKKLRDSEFCPSSGDESLQRNTLQELWDF